VSAATDTIRAYRRGVPAAASFRELHHTATPLVLPNAWDVPSALVFLDAGFPAIGTTSLGVAAAIGAPDGGRATMAANTALATALARLPCHVSMDIEDGYHDEPEQVADHVATLASLGVAGVNIEDSSAERLIPPQAHAAKVAEVKRRCPGLFVNARVDTYWLGTDATVAATVERALRYVEAGADGVFVPGATEPDVLRDLAASIPVPLNVLANPELSPRRLAELGVRRVSTGSLPYRAAMRAALDAATAARDGRPTPAALSYPDLQDRLVRYAQGVSTAR
jgi:2-methylisocitrate lyase-like PEP mutase family enzyme